MSAPDELLPCPFCSSLPLQTEAGPDDPRQVYCRHCRVGFAEYVDGDEDCVTAWNRRYIRAPDSAPNGLADELERMEDSSLSWTEFGSKWDAEFLRRILAALRNQPGGAVPRGEPVAWMLQKPDSYERVVYLHNASGDYPGWSVTKLYAATKAGEGET